MDPAAEVADLVDKLRFLIDHAPEVLAAFKAAFAPDRPLPPALRGARDPWSSMMFDQGGGRRAAPLHGDGRFNPAERRPPGA